MRRLLPNLTCSVKLSKKLKELGINQESYFYWSKYAGQYEEGHWGLRVYGAIPNFNFTEDSAFTCMSSFTTTELGTMLPEKIYCENEIFYLTITKKQGNWVLSYSSNDRHIIKQNGNIEANLKASALISLLESNFITAEEVNNNMNKKLAEIKHSHQEQNIE